MAHSRSSELFTPKINHSFVLPIISAGWDMNDTFFSRLSKIISFVYLENWTKNKDGTAPIKKTLHIADMLI